MVRPGVGLGSSRLESHCQLTSNLNAVGIKQWQTVAMLHVMMIEYGGRTDLERTWIQMDR